ncbi:MAG: substrate-binding domain-containing protein [Planctomycetota bacterium]
MKSSHKIWTGYRGAGHNVPTGKDEFEHCVRLAVGYLFEHLKARQRPDAIMATSDRPAFILAAACRLLGFKSGRDIRIVGYDNQVEQLSKEYAGLFEVNASDIEATVDKNNPEIGQALAAVAVEVSADRASPIEPIHRLVEPRLVVLGK